MHRFVKPPSCDTAVAHTAIQGPRDLILLAPFYHKESWCSQYIDPCISKLRVWFVILSMLQDRTQVGVEDLEEPYVK